MVSTKCQSEAALQVALTYKNQILDISNTSLWASIQPRRCCCARMEAKPAMSVTLWGKTK
eukprot:5938331-Amphidinium_carterae.3